jgi:hypothetical protein
MTAKNRNSKHNRRGPGGERATDKDTASYEQLLGSSRKPGAPGNLQNPRQPHENDESAHQTGDRMRQRERPPSDRQISQAAEDVESGRVDTDRRGIPSDVPRSKSK